MVARKDGKPRREVITRDPEVRDAVQQQVIGMLAAGMGPKAISEQVDITRESIHRWLREPEFKARLRDVQEANLAHAARAIQGAVTDAVRTLIEVCTDQTVEPQHRIRAASEILNRAGVVELGREAVPIAADVISVEDATSALRLARENENHEQH